MKGIQTKLSSFNKFFRTMPKRKKRILYVAIILFVLFSQIFALRFSVDMIIFTLLVFAIIRGESSQFFKDWVPPTLLYFLYECLRGMAFRLNQVTLNSEPLTGLLIILERKLFFFLPDIPTVLLQNKLYQAGRHDWYNNVLFFMYISFFWYWIVTAYLLWVKKRELFKPYIYGLLGFSIVGVLVFYLLPTAPPWSASERGLLPELARVMWAQKYLPSNTLELVKTYNRNDFAAIPSYHTAWPFFATFFLIKAFGRKALPLLLWAFLIAFATWYGAEHYVIDSIVGILFAGVTFYLVNHYTFNGFRFERREKSL